MKSFLFLFFQKNFAFESEPERRDYTAAEKQHWSQLCKTIENLPGNGSGFIEKLYRGKSLTVLREQLDKAKDPNNQISFEDLYDDSYSGEEEMEEPEDFQYEPNNYYMNMDIDMSLPDVPIPLEEEDEIEEV